MHLTHRPAERADYARCIALLQGDFALTPHQLSVLPQLWSALAAGGSLIMSVVEDHEREPAGRTVGMGASVFVTDRFTEEAKTTRPPNIGSQFVLEAMAGRSPALDFAAIARANSGPGLNVFVLHYAWDRDNLLPDDARAARDELIRAFLHEHRGYRLKEILLERHGEEAIRRVLTGGFLLRRDYADYYESIGSGPPPSERHPYLAGMSVDDALHAEGSTVSALFLYSPPRFRFRPGDQALLRRALMGETDEELAQSLSISPSAIKKRWAAIFDHCAAVAPDLFQKDNPQPEGLERKRGVEKRSRILAYLRHHPEDLRPRES